MLVKMGADIQGIGSNVLTVHGRAELHGCTHEIAPDHIEIGSFMALAGVTKGELRIKDTVPDDLRMIRLVFDRLGLHTDIDGNDVLVPGDQKLDRPARRGRVHREGAGRPVARVPRRPHVDRHRAGHAVGGPGAHPRVDVREPDDLHRQAGEHGGQHHPVRPASRDRLRTAPPARRAPGVARHPRRDGDAHRRAVRRGPQSEIGNIRQIDRGYERIDERLRELGARIERVATEPVPA